MSGHVSAQTFFHTDFHRNAIEFVRWNKEEPLRSLWNTRAIPVTRIIRTPQTHGHRPNFKVTSVSNSFITCSLHFDFMGCVRRDGSVLRWDTPSEDSRTPNDLGSPRTKGKDTSVSVSAVTAEGDANDAALLRRSTSLLRRFFLFNVGK